MLSGLGSQIVRFVFTEANNLNKYISKSDLPTCFIQTQIIKLSKHMECEKFIQNSPIPRNN